MCYTIDYFNARVLVEIERWPIGILADYLRIVELLTEFGPDLRMPHSRAMGSGLFELRPGGREGEGRALYCFASGRNIVVLHAFVKRTRTTRDRDRALARRRMKELRGG